MLKKYFVLFKTNWQSLSTYRGDLVVFVLSTCILPLVALLIWRAASVNNNLAYNQKELTSYFLAVIFVKQLTYSWAAYFVGEDILTGNFSSYLIRPITILEQYMMNNISEKVFKLFILLIILSIISFWMLGKPLQIPENPVIFLALIISISLGLLISLLMTIIVGLTTFWTHEQDFLRYLLGSFETVFSGLMVPIIFLPTLLQQIATFLPFKYSISFPAEIYLGKLTTGQILSGLAIQALWTIGLYFVYKVIYRNGIKLYQGYGS